MGATLLCELGLFLLCTLLCSGHAQDNMFLVITTCACFSISNYTDILIYIDKGSINQWWDSYEQIMYRETKYTDDLQTNVQMYCDQWRTEFSKVTAVGKKLFINLMVLVSDKPRATLTAGTTIIPVGGSVTLTCSVQSSDGWKYEWFRRTQRTSEVQIRDQQNRDIRVSQGGIYRCIGTRGNPVYYTYISDDVTIEITFSNKVVVKQQPNWPQIFRGETITLTCEVQEGGETTEWEYEWRGPSTPTQWTHNNDVTFRVSESSSGDYMCKSRRRDDSYSSTEWSEAFTLSASTAPEPESSSFVTPLIVGLVCGVLLILLLLLLCRFKQSKDSFFVRTRSTNQSSAMNHMIKDEAQHSRHASTLQGDACVYESIKDLHDTQNDDSVLHAEVSHDRVKTKKDNDDSLLYAQVYYTKAKPKRHKGKPAPAAADETVYSEVKSQTALGNCAEIK
ncbi:unnamed protein product [Oreochromis niloticus]|nr:unnamed protein product [Mustela putorius furo]